MEADLAASQGSLVQTSDFPNERHLCLQVPQGRCHLVEVGCDCSRSAEEETEGSKGGEKQRGLWQHPSEALPSLRFRDP